MTAAVAIIAETFAGYVVGQVVSGLASDAGAGPTLSSPAVSRVPGGGAEYSLPQAPYAPGGQSLAQLFNDPAPGGDVAGSIPSMPNLTAGLDTSNVVPGWGSPSPELASSVMSGPPPEQPGFFSSAVSAVKDQFTPDNLAKAGLKTSGYLLTSALAPQGPDMGKVNSYLDSVNGMQQQANQFNLDQGVKKSAVGDSLVQTARNYDPQYFAQQGEAGFRSAAGAQWADYEQQLRKDGHDDNYINAEKSRFDLDTSAGAGTAYNQGWAQSGQKAQTDTLRAASDQYAPLDRVPTASLTDDYTRAMEAASKKQQAMGGLVNSVLGAGDETTGAASTAQTRPNPGSDPYAKQPAGPVYS